MDFFKLRENAGEFGTDKLKKKYEDETPGQNEKYRPPTKAEIDADKKKDQKGKPRPSITAKSVNRKVYGKMMGGLKEGINQKAFAAGAKGMKAYAQKSGGIDKADFMKVAKSLETISRINILQAGQELSRLNRMVDGMDTDVRERIYVELKKVGLVESIIEKADDDTVRMIKANPKMKDKILRGLNPKARKEIEKALNEELKVSDGAAKWIADFQASDAPQFQGKSDDEKKKMAIAAFMAAKAKEGGDKKEPQNESLDEAKFSPKDIKMAIGIASDKRYAGGNMSGAVKAMDKMKPGISDHPQVRAVLKRQNEDLAEAAPKIKGPSMKGGKIMGVPGKQIGQKLDIEPQVNGMKLMFRVTTSDGSLKTVDAAGLAKMLR